MTDGRFVGMEALLSRPSPFGNETGSLPNGEFEPGPELFQRLRTDTKVLVVGAGGLGCEILKNLVLSGFTDIHVIDLDTIDVTNLNRQFLFRQADVGRGKAEVAAEFIQKRVPGCKVTAYKDAIQKYDEDFYRQFKIIVSGLDNIDARRWLNSRLVELVELDEDGEIDPATIIPMVDGGTEGFKGQARVIIPRVTSCFECSLDSFTPTQAFQICTIAETPRSPEHCIAYAMLIQWDKEFPGRKLDKDSPDDMQWLFQRALERAQTYGIEGVTYFKTLGVVKNVIPAVAATNATIAAACCNEALKLVTFCGQTLNSYFMYMGAQSIYTSSFEYGKKDQCIVCGDGTFVRVMSVMSAITLGELFELFAADPTLQLKTPSASTITQGADKTLYMRKPKALEEQTRANLSLPLAELFQSGDILGITDDALAIPSISIQIDFAS